MITLNTKATVSENSLLTISLPKNLPKGEYNIVIVIDDVVHADVPLWAMNLKGNINLDERFRRENNGN